MFACRKSSLWRFISRHDAWSDCNRPRKKCTGTRFQENHWNRRKPLHDTKLQSMKKQNRATWAAHLVASLLLRWNHAGYICAARCRIGVTVAMKVNGVRAISSAISSQSVVKIIRLRTVHRFAYLRQKINPKGIVPFGFDLQITC